MFFGVGVSCRILYSIVSYLYVSCSGLITSELICLLSFTCNYVLSVLMCNFFSLIMVFPGYFLLHLILGKLFSLQNFALSLS